MASGDDIHKAVLVWERCRALIDPMFHSAYSKAPFKSCLICDKKFVQGAVRRQYIIMKTFVHNETIVELAVCERCRQAMSKQTSTESRKRITAFFEKHLRLCGSYDKCGICSRNRLECRSYTLYAYCVGQEMVTHSYPFMLCDRCEEEAQELMSAQTRGWQDDFMDKYSCGPDPAVKPERVPLLV